MLQVIQDFKSGEIRLIDVPPPTLAPGMVLVQTRASAISVGTERATADVGRKSLIGKARPTGSGEESPGQRQTRRPDNHHQES